MVSPTTHQDHHKYLDQMQKYLLQSKSELKETAKYNLHKRLKKMIGIIQTKLQLKSFKIPSKDVSEMVNDINNAISTWKGVELQSCKKQKKTYREYKITAQNWFNRNKAKIFGNYFFFPLIFKYLLNFIQSNVDVNQMRLFIDILVLLFNENIQFKRTKSQSLIPYQTIIQPNLFKTECIKFINFYHILWDKTDIVPAKINRVYQKDRARSRKIYRSFIKSLVKVQKSILNSTPVRFYRVQTVLIQSFKNGVYSQNNNNNNGCSIQKSCTGIAKDMIKNDNSASVIPYRISDIGDNKQRSSFSEIGSKCLQNNNNDSMSSGLTLSPMSVNYAFTNEHISNERLRYSLLSKPNNNNNNNLQQLTIPVSIRLNYNNNNQFNQFNQFNNRLDDNYNTEFRGNYVMNGNRINGNGNFNNNNNNNNNSMNDIDNNPIFVPLNDYSSNILGYSVSFDCIGSTVIPVIKECGRR